MLRGGEMGNRYPVLVRDVHGLQLYSVNWALSTNDFEAKLKMEHHYYKNRFEYIGLLTSDPRLIERERAELSFKKRLVWFLRSIKRAFKANILEGQQFDIYGEV